MRPLPPKVQNLCKRFLEDVRQNPEHHLSAANRFTLYCSFGKFRFLEFLPSFTASSTLAITTANHLSRFTVADFTICWLAGLTAKKVLPIWNRIWQQVDFEPDTVTSPEEILSVAEAILTNEIDIEYIRNIEHDKYNLGANVTWETSYDVACVYSSTYSTLQLILYGFDGQMDIRGLYRTTEEDIVVRNNDFVSLALQAYTSSDKNKPGDWILEAPPQLIEFDVQKRQEFWDWWLTEVIPQAWELAQEFTAIL